MVSLCFKLKCEEGKKPSDVVEALAIYLSTIVQDHLLYVDSLNIFLNTSGDEELITLSITCHPDVSAEISQTLLEDPNINESAQVVMT